MTWYFIIAAVLYLIIVVDQFLNWADVAVGPSQNGSSGFAALFGL